MSLSYDVIQALNGKTVATAESCTGGRIGAALTSVPGSSKVYKGGVISYTNWVKQNVLNVDSDVLEKFGAVSAHVAQAMAEGARLLLNADIAVSVTGLAGPDGDDFGNPVGTVYIGYADKDKSYVNEYCFTGNREAICMQAVRMALQIICEENR